MLPGTSQRAGTVGGLALVLLVQLESAEILKTVILAAVGATSSYLVTLTVKFLLRRCRQKHRKP